MMVIKTLEGTPLAKHREKSLLNDCFPLEKLPMTNMVGLALR